MKETPLNKVVGRFSNDPAGARKRDEEQALKNTYAKQSISDIDPKDEIEKTPNHKQIIEAVNRFTNEVLAQYGLPAFNVDESKIHLIPVEMWRKIKGAGDDLGGFYHPILQSVLMPDHPVKAVFAHRLAHEIFHLKSYNVLKVDETRSAQFRTYRGGIRIHSNEGEVFFNILNEAITEELAIECVKRLYNKSRVFRDDKNQTEQILKKYPNAARPDGTILAQDKEIFYAWIRASGADRIIETEIYNRKDERDILSLLMQRIQKKNPEFKDTAPIFRIFVQAAFAGNMLPLRIIDRTFGEGTFRKIGELDGSLPELKKYIESL